MEKLIIIYLNHRLMSIWVFYPKNKQGGPVIDQILKILMFKQDKRVTQVAREADIPQQTLQRIVAGLSPNPHQKTLGALAEYFSVSINQLTGKEPLPEDQAVVALPLVKPQNMHQAPRLDQVNVEKYLETRDKNLVTGCLTVEGEPSNNTFVINMNDSSMEPYVPQNAVLILDHGRAPRDRDFVLASLEDTQTQVFRQILIDGERRYLKPMNPDLAAFPMRLLKPEDRILGTLTELRHRYDQ